MLIKKTSKINIKATRHQVKVVEKSLFLLRNKFMLIIFIFLIRHFYNLKKKVVFKA